MLTAIGAAFLTLNPREIAMRYIALGTFMIAALSFVSISPCIAGDQWGLATGVVELKSAGPIVFGPQGVLFVGDPAAAMVYAIATSDPSGDASKVNVNVPDIAARVAEALAIDEKQVQLGRLAASPVSGNVYMSVNIKEPKSAALVRIDAQGKVSKVALENVKFSKCELPGPPKDVAAAGRRGNPRDDSINDLAWTSSKLIVAGLAGDNPLAAVQEIPFPFSTNATWTDVEIYHGSHGRVEDAAPVRTLVPFRVDGQSVLLAGFTCTPLVMFPLESLQAGKKVRGKTIAELGNGNRPLNMFVYNKGGKDYVLMSNSSRGVMKISTDKIQENEGIDAPVRGKPTAGQPFETITSLRGVLQMDRLNDDHLIYLAKADNGAIALHTAELP
jgi:hypothetical protein